MSDVTEKWGHISHMVRVTALCMIAVAFFIGMGMGTAPPETNCTCSVEQRK